jgi:histidyl-tRNA synthetase
MTTEIASSMRSRGMRDLLPSEMDRVRSVEDAFASTCRAWGYREIRTPVIEPLHLFTSAGTLSPRMLDTVYSFLDWDGWSGERVVLRPDSTIPAARLYAERFGGGRVAKLFYIQNIFRFTDDGASREEWQCGVELIGDTGVTGDVELVLLALETLAPLGLPPLTVRLSHAGLVRAVLAAAGMAANEQSAAYDRLLDGDLGVVDEAESRLPQLNAPLRLLFEVEGAGSGYIANLRGALASAIPALTPALDNLAFVVASLEARGIAPVIQSVLARSFEYYSGLVFKIYAGGERICSGGRYDDLVALVGDAGVPASGFAHYVSPLVAQLPRGEPERRATRVVVQASDATPESVAETFAVATRLRAAGLHTEVTAGMESAPAHRVVCPSVTGSFTVVTAGTESTFETLDAVIEALERGR